MERDVQKRGPEAGSFREWLDRLLHTGLPSVGAAEHFTPSLHGVDSRPHPQGGSSEPKGWGERERPLQSQPAAGNGLLESVSAHQHFFFVCLFLFHQHFSSQASHLTEVSCCLLQGEVVEYVDDLLELEETG